jgi:pSer/pThr/pTyr-binding forkhead associated (FHA) protein
MFSTLQQPQERATQHISAADLLALCASVQSSDSARPHAPRELTTYHFLSSPPLAPIWLRAGARLTIGRDSSCELCLTGRWVSREHASFELRDNRAILIDLGSANGTYVNDEPVEERELEIGDIVNIGGFLFTYRTSIGTKPTAALREDRTAG